LAESYQPEQSQVEAGDQDNTKLALPQTFINRWDWTSVALARQT
jgi:hypothetical protein